MEPINTEYRRTTHQETHLRSSDFISDIVIGMSDGLTVPFALAAGLSGAVASSSLVVTAGIAEVVAGSIAMGLGGYLAGRTEADHYDSERRREAAEVDTVPEREKEEVREVFADMGLSPILQTAIADELAKNKAKWPGRRCDGFYDEVRTGPRRARSQPGHQERVDDWRVLRGGWSGAADALFSDRESARGPAVLQRHHADLFVFGYFKAKFTGQPPVSGAVKVMLIGAAAAAAAFSVARLFGG